MKIRKKKPYGHRERGPILCVCQYSDCDAEDMKDCPQGKVMLENARLKAELADLRADIETLTQSNAEADAEIGKLRAELAKMKRQRDALVPFVQHLSGCRFSRSLGYEGCECGLDAALRGGKEG
jgi:hypothetical protein